MKTCVVVLLWGLLPSLANAQCSLDKVPADWPIPVSIINLIASPERYDGKTVFVSGWVGWGYRTQVLHFSPERQKLGDPFDAVWLEFAEGLLEEQDPAIYNGQLVTVTGVFRCGRYGDQGMFPGAIVSIGTLVPHPPAVSPVGTAPESPAPIRSAGANVGGTVPENVAFVELIALPERFDEKRVVVVGCGGFGPERNALYMLEEFKVRQLTLSALELEFDQEFLAGLQPGTLQSLDGKYIIVEGVFDKDRGGDMGVFQGTIRSVNRIVIWDIGEEEWRQHLRSISAGSDQGPSDLPPTPAPDKGETKPGGGG